MKSNFLIILIFIWAIITAGCSGKIMSSVNVSIDDNIPMSAEYRKKAHKYEKVDELQLALFHLKIAESLDVKNMEIKKQVAALEDNIENESARHFKIGVEKYQSGDHEGARTKFLTALRYDPDNDEAFIYLKEVMAPKVFSTYVVGKGDTFESITEKMYGDKSRSFIIAELNDYTDVDNLKQNDKLRVPVLSVYPEEEKEDRKKVKKKPTVRKANIKIRKSRVKIERPKKKAPEPQAGLLKEAKELFRDGKYEEVVLVTEKILKSAPSNADARELKNASYFHLGKMFSERGEYFKALRYFGSVEQDYKGVQDEIALIKDRMKIEAEAHYEKGQEYYDNNEYRKAILEWARALTYNPEHKDARKDMEKARSILKKREELK